MAWVKFLIILPAAITWLRSMRLCVDDSDDLQLDVDSWAAKIFAWGMAGILTAVILPAWVVGAGVLGATCGIPCVMYVRWRNSQVTDSDLKVGWKTFLIVPRPRKRKAPDVQFVMPYSGLAASNVIGNISFVGRSFSDGVVNSFSDAEERKPSGMRTTLTLLSEALSRHATDIHVATKEDKVVVRLRIDGRIVALDPLPRETGLSLINVFKVLGDLNIADRKRAQDGSFRVDVDGRRLCFRVASQGTDTGEKLSIRILDPAANLATFPALGFTGQLEGRLASILNRSSGLILFCGATGAGKSTTAYAALRYLDSGDRNVVTIEDPIEYSIPSVDQIEVKTRFGQTFEASLRSVLRQDADVILIGEIRDDETAKIACQAATTGQLVLSTLHATDPVAAIYRMLDLNVPSYNLASAIRGVVSQQLFRKLCQECRIEYTADDKELKRLALPEGHGPLYTSPDPTTNTCLNCNGKGFVGRTGVFGLMEITPAIRDLIRDSAKAGTMTSVAREHGLTTVRDECLRLLLDGVISPQEFQRVIDEN